MSTQATDNKPPSRTVEKGQRWQHKGVDRTVADFSDTDPLKSCVVFHEIEEGTVNQPASAIIEQMLTQPEWIYIEG